MPNNDTYAYTQCYSVILTGTEYSSYIRANAYFIMIMNLFSSHSNLTDV